MYDIDFDCGYADARTEDARTELIQIERDLKNCYPFFKTDIDDFRKKVIRYGNELANIQAWFNRTPIIPELTGYRKFVASQLLNNLVEYYNFVACARRGKIPNQMYIPQDVTIKLNVELHDNEPDYITMYSGDVKITGSIGDMETLIGHAFNENQNEEIFFKAGTYVRDYVSTWTYWDQQNNFVQLIM